MATKKKQAKSAKKVVGASKTVAPKKVTKSSVPKTSVKSSAKAKAFKPPKAAKPSKAVKSPPTSPKSASPSISSIHKASLVKPPQNTPPKVTPSVTAKKTPAPEALEPTVAATKPAAAPKAKNTKTTLDDLALDIDEKDELLEEEKRDLIKALRDDEDEPLETAFVPTDTSERVILVVDEEGQRRNETVTIVQQILPNAIVEVADDPEEALEVMQEADFDTYVVNFLMPGFSASLFVKAVANHPDHPLLIGFAADKISDALDQRKGLKIIPLKRLFDLDVSADTAASKEKPGAED